MKKVRDQFLKYKMKYLSEIFNQLGATGTQI